MRFYFTRSSAEHASRKLNAVIAQSNKYRSVSRGYRVKPSGRTFRRWKVEYGEKKGGVTSQ